MLWWSWVLLWTVLVLLGAALLGLLLWRSARSALGVLRDAEAAAGDFAQRWDAAASGVQRPVRTPPEPAVLTPVGRALAEYRLGRDQRETARLARRMARKDRMGQPQRISDLRRAERKGMLHG
ncbi:MULTISPECIES: hypothetical protein [Kocuria]|jgi:hypothetical protein|uniref:hypothetical protein n=1 Tax=Kocuria TaxID=57493 RepID=UPI00203FBBA5|nr:MULTISPECIES: hypothetical protein [Kocuria]MCM3689366.1 hypothetical protein [Kocuria rosea]HST71344.1 hypothetical protein [Kocuria rosea]